MSVVISDSKLVYPEFKFFKPLYTSLNISPILYLYYDKRDETLLLKEVNNEEPKILIGFESDSQFYQLQGEISGNTEFFKWLKTVNIIKIEISTINILSKCLKKNATSIEYENGEFFRFHYIDKETNESTVIEIREDKLSVDCFFEKYSCNKFSLNKTYFLSDIFLNSEILTVFRDSAGKICNTRTKDKLLEIPTARIKSLIKAGISEISMSDRLTDGTRYVSISSKNLGLGLKLTQTFKTI